MATPTMPTTSSPGIYHATMASVASSAIGLAASAASWLASRAAGTNLSDARRRRRGSSSESSEPDSPAPSPPASHSRARTASAAASLAAPPDSKRTRRATRAPASEVIDLTGDSDGDEDAAAGPDSLREPMPASASDADLVRRAFRGPADRVLAAGDFSGFGSLKVTRRDMACLRPKQWVNDEAMNFFLALVQQRHLRRWRAQRVERSGVSKAPDVHIFNTFFYNKLFSDAREYSYANVKRWTRRKTLGYCVLDCKLLLVPIHKGGDHWVLVSVDLSKGSISYLDSLHGEDRRAVGHIARYLEDEAAARRRPESVRAESLRRAFPRQGVPRQLNGFDCGVFAMMFAERMADGRPLDFSQRDATESRDRIAVEIQRGGAP